MIPKIIHYCWFGGKKLGEQEKKCIDSWKKYLPDYEIKLWNEKNYDINKNKYIQQAYKEKKYAFVSDYVRFDVLYQFGGIYFDTDVEVIKNLEDIIEQGAFMGREAGIAKLAVAPGLGIGAEAGNLFYKEVLDYYDSLAFIKEDGSYNMVTVVNYTTNLLLKYGLKDVNSIQEVRKIKIYPEDFFCPMNSWTKEVVITENTRTIHHYAASWISEEQKKMNEEIKRISKYVGLFWAGVIVIYKYEYKKNGIRGVIKITKNKIMS